MGVPTESSRNVMSADMCMSGDDVLEVTTAAMSNGPCDRAVYPP